MQKRGDPIQSARHFPPLAAFPKKGRQVPEAEPKHEAVRELLFRSYRMIYRIDSERAVEPES